MVKKLFLCFLFIGISNSITAFASADEAKLIESAGALIAAGAYQEAISILELKLDSGFISDAQRAHAYSILATAYELTNRKLQAYSYYEKAMLANKNISNYRTEKNIFHLLWKYYYQEKEFAKLSELGEQFIEDAKAAKDIEILSWLPLQLVAICGMAGKADCQKQMVSDHIKPEIKNFGRQIEMPSNQFDFKTKFSQEKYQQQLSKFKQVFHKKLEQSGKDKQLQAQAIEARKKFLETFQKKLPKNFLEMAANKIEQEDKEKIAAQLHDHIARDAIQKLVSSLRMRNSVLEDKECSAAYFQILEAIQLPEKELIVQHMSEIDECISYQRIDADVLYGSLADRAQIEGVKNIEHYKFDASNTQLETAVLLFSKMSSPGLKPIPSIFRLAEIAFFEGRFADAEARYFDILDILSNTTDLSVGKTYRTLVHTKLGELYIQTGRIEQAKTYIQSAVGSSLEIMVSESDKLQEDALFQPNANMGLFDPVYPIKLKALLYAQTGSLKKALKVYSNALKTIDLQRGIPKNAGRIWKCDLLTGMANVYIAMNNGKHAYDAIRLAMKTYGIEPGSSFTPRFADQYLVLAQASLLQGHNELALSSIEIVESSTSQIGDTISRWSPDIHFTKGIAFYRLDNYEKCVQELLKSVKAIQFIKANTLYILPEYQKRAFNSTYKMYLDALFSVVRDHRVPMLEDIFSLWINWKGSVATDSKKVYQALNSKDSDHSQSLRQQLFLVNSTIAAYLSKKGDQSHHLKQLVVEKNNLEHKLLISNSTLSKGHIQPIESDKLMQALPEKSIYVDIVHYTYFDMNTLMPIMDRYAAFLTDGTIPIKLIQLGAAQKFEIAVRKFHAAIDQALKETPRRFPDKKVFERLGSIFYEGGLKSLTSTFGATKRIVWVPDGIFHFLPLEIVPIPESGYFDEIYDIVYLTQARDILEFDPVQSSEQVAIFADPDYDLLSPIKITKASSDQAITTRGILGKETISEFNKQQSQRKFSSLPDTHQEAMTISDIVSMVPSLKPVLFLGGEATETALRALQKPKILHMATHGEATIRSIKRPLEEQMPKLNLFSISATKHFGYSKAGPESMFIALAGANRSIAKQQGDGILTQEKIAACDFQGTELVVLSACSSGLGGVEPGEGVFGLKRAFLLSGAKQVMCSLWPVASAQTKSFMEYYYRSYIKNQDARKAIKEARKKLRQIYPSPYFWGAFIVAGVI